MDIKAYRDEIKLKLTGRVLDLELDDPTLDSIINASLREIQRYIGTTTIVTIPYTPCIDMSKYKVNSVTQVYRSQGFGLTDGAIDSNAYADPMYLGLWQAMSGYGNLYNINEWAYNYASWNTALQIRNTVSTDLAFRYDRNSELLYINCGFDRPDYITIEYVPRYSDVSEVKSDFWIDVIVKFAVALTKQIVGRIRSRYTQNNAQWAQDGETLLSEANAEIADIREKLSANTQLSYPID